MFGKMGDLMGKMQEMKQKSQEVKKRLDTITVNGEAEGGLVTVVCNGNRKITSINISEDISADKEQIEELVLLATNRALDKAEKVAEAEMAGIAKGMLPGL